MDHVRVIYACKAGFRFLQFRYRLMSTMICIKSSRGSSSCVLAYETFTNQLATSLNVLTLSSCLQPSAHDDCKAVLHIVPTLPGRHSVKP